ncbi:diguanylate cyclase domain-containing protein [Spongisporangium articulatum]|uniref:Diguanylate cyclase domain-containing protein n=1 Tax=Spongisporangium articulatum TaxID=3362603 RepID=A0ABW8AJ90_9ACTN
MGPVQGTVPEIREHARVTAVQAMHLVDEPMSAGVAEAVRMAAEICGVPNAVLNIFDSDTQHSVVTEGLELSPVPRADSMCANVVSSGTPIVTRDASREAVFDGNPFVTGDIAELKFYASFPLTTSDGHTVGTLCAYDEHVRDLTPEQLTLMEVLAGQVVEMLEIREAMASATRAADELAREAESVTSILRGATDAYVGVSAHDLVLGWNEAAERLFGRPAREAIGMPVTLALGLVEEAGVAQLHDGLRFPAERSDGAELMLEASSWAAEDGGWHAFIRDVTELAAEQAARRDAEALLQIAFDHAPHGTAVLGATTADAGRIMRVNPALVRMTYREDLLGSDLASLLDPEENASVLAAFESLVTGETDECELPATLLSSGGRIFVQAFLALSRDSRGRPHHVLAQLRDVTHEKAYAEMLTRQATSDPLTGLANRLLMRQTLLKEIDALRSGDGPLAVMLLDLDGFKFVNDELGHEAGDSVLVAVAEGLVEGMPPDATVCRLGGDEFLVVVPRCRPTRAADLAVDIRRMVQEVAAGLAAPATGRLGVSVGMAFADNPATVPEEVVREADRSMYSVKRDSNRLQPSLGR